ncbi:MAG: type III-A CRISPR-associated RAMP protein Csm3 [Bacteroidota bacterium]
MKLLQKIFIEGKIHVETGMHIGGAKNALDIGGLDLAVVKTADQRPYIPGSSFRGKLRSLHGRQIGSLGVTKNDVDAGKGELYDADEERPEVEQIARIFGLPGKQKPKAFMVSRLTVRDAAWDGFSPTAGINEDFMDFPYTEAKWENRINRKSGTAKDPRQLERVPAGGMFEFEMVYDSYEDGHESDDIHQIISLMRMLEDDYLGGHGSRGYGKIKFEDVVFKVRTIDDYKAGKPATENTPYQWKKEQP